MNAPGSIVAVIFWLLAGLALFLYGIDMMSQALRKAAGPSIRKAFNFVSRTRFHGLLVGTIITGFIQSSSATTVMVVGFISAGLLKFSQSIGIILGANIGATITPQITAFKIDEIALPLIGIGFLFTFFKRRALRQTGFAVMGFGVLFFGLILMKFAVKGYSADIQAWLSLYVGTSFSGQLIAFLVAAAATAVIQSSAATVAMLQVIALTAGNMGFEFFIPMIVGAQVGTCITAMLASLQSSLSAKRAAVAHLVFNIFGALITLVLYRFYVWVVPMTSTEIVRQIANVHLFSRVVNVALFLPFTTVYGRFITRILPGKDRFNAAPQFLDFEQVKHPEIAIKSASLEIMRMYENSLEMLDNAVTAFIERDSAAVADVLKYETLVDDLYKTTGEFLIMVSKAKMPLELSPLPALWMHLMGDVERIGDHAENIVELLQVQAPAPVRFSESEIEDINQTLGLVQQMGSAVQKAMEDEGTDHMLEVLELKEKVNAAVDLILDSHVHRLEKGTTTSTGGIIFVELIINLRRVANHLRNIAATITGKMPEQTAQVRKLKEEL